MNLLTDDQRTDTPEPDFAVCQECGAEDVLFLPHLDDCTRQGDIIVTVAR